MSRSAGILVVDGLPETTEVLKAVFEPLGHEVHRIRSHQRWERTARPGVVVWHEDSEHESTFADDSLQDVPRVLIGRTQLSEQSDSRQFAHPFEYGELLKAVEVMLQQA